MIEEIKFDAVWSPQERIESLPEDIRSASIYSYNEETEEKESVDINQLVFDDEDAESLFFSMVHDKLFEDIHLLFTFYKLNKELLLKVVFSEHTEVMLNFLDSIDASVLFLAKPTEMSMRKECIDYISEKLTEGSTILEFGSGVSTQILSNKFNMISIEEDEYWANKYDSDYLHAPIVDGWYDIDMVNDFLKDKSYDAIIIDGPAEGDRQKIVELIENDKIKIDKNVKIFIDDVQRSKEYMLALKLSASLGRRLKVDEMKRIGKDINLLIGYIKEIEND